MSGTAPLTEEQMSIMTLYMNAGISGEYKYSIMQYAESSYAKTKSDPQKKANFSQTLNEIFVPKTSDEWFNLGWSVGSSTIETIGNSLPSVSQDMVVNIAKDIAKHFWLTTLYVAYETVDTIDQAGPALTGLGVSTVVGASAYALALDGAFVTAALPLTSSTTSPAVALLIGVVAGYMAGELAEYYFQDIIDANAQGIVDTADAVNNLFNNIGSGFNATLDNIANTPNVFNELPKFLDDYSDGLGGIFDFLPSWLAPVGGLFNDVPAMPVVRGGGDPLVLDLDGDGVEASKLGYGTGASTTYFDMDNDGFAERTAWATGGDGLLALDKNGNGKIDNQSELFGDSDTLPDGFTNLKQYDSNNDNKMTSADAQWNKLRVWVDTDGDAVTDAGELKTLSSLNITQINLGATLLIGVTNNENTVAATSSFVMNGVTKTINEIWFRHDAMDTHYQGDVTIDVRTLFLPTLKGFGNLKDLHVAMSQDTILLTMVQNLTKGWSISKFKNPTALDNEIKSILYKWAGVDTVADGSRGTFIDAKVLTFMETITGSPYGSNSTLGFTQPSHAVHVPPVMTAFEIAFDSFKAQLLVQIGAGNLFTATPIYNLATGELSSGEISASAINLLKTEALTLSSSARDAFWKSAVEYIINVKDIGNLNATEINSLNSAIIASGTGQTWESISTTILSQYLGSYRVTDLSDHAVGSPGNDTLHGLGGDDIINGRRGNDVLFGDAGDDTYRFNVADGQDIIYEESGNDIILMGAGITASNIRFEKNGYDLNIYYGTSDKITLHYHLYDNIKLSNTRDEVETLKFADGTSINLKGGLTFTGTSGADNINGTSMNDILIGSTGNDILSGITGDDTYRFNIADGQDIIYEESGNDIILMGTGITASNIRFEKNGYDLNIYYGTLDKITLRYHLYDDVNLSNSMDEVETLKFADGTSINLKGGLTFTGTSGADSTYGTNINDILTGLAGDDYLYAYNGNDILIGGTGNDTLSGVTGDDTYRFNIADGQDIIYESSGNDIILMGAGITASNIRFEKNGYDLNIYYGTSDKITLHSHLYDDVNLSNSRDEVETLKFADGTSINLKGGLTFTGTSGADRTYGTNMNDILTGLAGDDSLSAYGGNDILNGEAGNDYLYAYSGNDTLIGGSGNDSLFGSTGDDTYRFNVADGQDIIYEESGNDIILMGAGITASNIRFEKNGYDLNIYYGTSDKIILDSHLYDDVNLSNSRDEVETLKFADGTSINLKGGLTFTGTSGADSTYGTNMNDILTGLVGDDYLSAYGGNDILDGGMGNDYLYGGTGMDTATYINDTAAVKVNLSISGQQNTIGSGFDTLVEIENLVGSSYNDTLTGDANANTIQGENGNDIIDGGLGNDILNGGAGNDTIKGNTGIDTASYAGTATAVTVNLSLTSAQNTLGAGTDTLIGIENLIGSSYNDTLTGDANANLIDGGAGNDTMNGGLGNDTLIGNSGIDTISYAGIASGVTVNLTITTGQNTLGAGTDTITSSENLIGSSYNDTLTGDTNANTIEGGLGNDILNGGLGVDTISYASSTTAVSVNLALTTAQNTIGAGTDILSNFENIFASAFNDTLTGNSVANTINGGAGNDLVIGGLGADILTGGLGTDTFRFLSTGLDTNLDRITDFSTAQGDKIDLKNLLVGYDPITKAITNFVEFTTVGSNTLVKVDRDGTGTTYGWQQVAQLDNLTGLTDETALKASGHLIVA